MSINIQTENNELKKIAGTYGTNIESNITTDSELSLESSNPIQNQAVAQGLNTIEDTVGAIRLTKKYIGEHTTLSSFINGLKENTCYVFVLTHSTLSEALTLANIGFLHQQRENGILKISCGFNKYGIFVEFSDGINDIQQRSIIYNPNYTDNYELNDWHRFITEDGSVKHADTAENADTVDGYHINDSPSADPRGKIPIVKDDGVMEVGKYIDFHASTADLDNDARITADYDKMEINKPIESPGIKTSSLTVSKSFSGYGEPQFVVENPTYPNAKVIGYVDQEGGNFRLQCNEKNNYYEFDTLGNDLRLYHYYNGSTPTLISSVGSGANLELQIARATKDSDGNVIKDTYAKKSDLNSSGSGNYIPTLDGTSNYSSKSTNKRLILGAGFSGGPVITQYYGSIGIADYHGNVSNGILIDSGQVTPRDFLSDSRPIFHGNMNLGSSAYAWSGVYSRTSLTVTSDKNLKNTIKEIDLNIVEQLIEKILSYTYKLNDGSSGRIHYGMIAQQVGDVLEELGIDTKDFAAFIKSPVTEDIIGEVTDENGEFILDPETGDPIIGKIGEKETGEYIYMIRYGELVPILWANAKDKNRKIEQLQNSNEELSNKVVSLEERIEKLESYINIKDTIDAEGRFQ